MTSDMTKPLSYCPKPQDSEALRPNLTSRLKSALCARGAPLCGGGFLRPGWVAGVRGLSAGMGSQRVEGSYSESQKVGTWV